MNSPLKKAPFLMGMPMKIGVMGQADGFDKSHVDAAHQLGMAIAEDND